MERNLVLQPKLFKLLIITNSKWKDTAYYPIILIID